MAAESGEVRVNALGAQRQGAVLVGTKVLQLVAFVESALH